MRLPSASMRVAKPKLFEHGKAGRLQDQPRPKRPRRLELIEKRDAMPVARQKERGRKPGRTGPGNRDRQRLHRRLPQPLLPLATEIAQHVADQ